MIAIRGAITVENNTKTEILESTKVLLQEVIKSNGIHEDDMISLIFTATRDLTKAYPAVAARELGLTTCTLSCMQEMYVEGSLPMCIRLLLYINRDSCQKQAKHVYLREAKILRPDLTGQK